MWNGIFVIIQIIVVGILKIGMMSFKLKKHERDAINKSNYIGPATVQFAYHFQLSNSKKVIPQRVIKIKNFKLLFCQLSFFIGITNIDAFCEEVVFFFIDLSNCFIRRFFSDLINGILISYVRQSGIKLF